MKKIIVHEFQVVPNIFGFLPRGKYNLPNIKVPDTFIKALITDNLMDNIFNPYIELKMVITTTGLHIFDEDSEHICLNLN